MIGVFNRVLTGIKNYFIALIISVIFSAFLIHTQRVDYIDAERSFCGAEDLNCSDACISDTLICDGTSDCEDGADEYFWICKYQRCPDYAYTCTFGECVSREQLCDGVENCRLGSDEKYYVCPPMYPACGEFESDDSLDIFPWHAAVWRETEEGPVKICASTIVAPTYLISAADCFWDFTSNRISEYEFTATSELVNNVFKQARKIKNIYTNNYHRTDNETDINNIAVVELEQSFTFNDLTSAACLFDYKRAETKISLYSHFYSEMITWSPGPFNYNGPKRITLKRYLNAKQSIAGDRSSEISNETTKYVSNSNTCGPLSDHGGGSFLRLNNVYYLQSVINAPLGDVNIMSCLDRIHTYVLPHTSFIRATINNDRTSINITEAGDKYVLDVEIEAPRSLFPACGKFDIFDYIKPFPWAVVIWAETSGGPRQNCSGTIIHDKMVVSAASCFWNDSSNSLNNVTYTVTAGVDGATFKQIRQVSNIALFNYYNSDDEPYANNVALLILDEAFVFDGLVAAVCIYDPDVLLEIPVPIQFGGAIVTWTYGLFNEVRQVPMTFAMNKNCPSKNISNVNEVYKFCARAVNLPDALAPMNLGSGFYVNDGGQFYLRGIMSSWLEPINYSWTYIFSNFLPFIQYINDIVSKL